MNPVAFIFILIVGLLFFQTLNSNTPLNEKLLFLVISGSMYVIAAFFEFWRIDREEEQKERTWRNQVLSG
jgi:predicted membrane channel-forming protein YqfA (hemolysin III family)